MKEKILPFIIGILIGAIITTGGFLIYNKTNPRTFSNNKQMMRGERPQRPDNEDGAPEDLKNKRKGKTSENGTQNEDIAPSELNDSSDKSSL